MNRLIFVACTALIMFSGCKARKILNTKTDSTVVSQKDKSVSSLETKVDTGKKVTKTTTVSQDSSKTTIEATPVPGTKTTINTDGSITGEFTNVKSTNTKKTNTNKTENTVEQKGESTTKKVDSLVKTKQQTNVKKSVKTVDAKPKQGAWPWVIGLVVIIALLILLWWFLGKPRGMK